MPLTKKDWNRYYAATRDKKKQKEYFEKYYAENKAKIIARAAKWNKEHRKRRKEIQSKSDKKRAQNRNRRDYKREWWRKKRAKLRQEKLMQCQ